jgi:hypothetical protein
MSEAGTEASEEDRLEEVQRTEPDPDLAEDIGPAPVPVSAEQLAAGRDAVPTDVAGPEGTQQLAEESHDDAGPEQEQPE